MTEYWVSQGNKWCEYCKVWMSNNPSTIRMHELGQKHKECVSQKLHSIRQDASAKERERKEAERTIGLIERKAKRQYEQDVANQKRLEGRADNDAMPSEKLKRVPPPPSTPPPPHLMNAARPLTNQSVDGDGWSFDQASGYYFNPATGYHYDPNSGLYYTELLGRWSTMDEASSASGVPAEPDHPNSSQQQKEGKGSGEGAERPRQSIADVAATNPSLKGKPKAVSSSALGIVAVAGSKAIGKGAKGIPSSLTTAAKQVKGKRGRDEASGRGKVSEEEARALAAREAARQRVLEREKQQLGTYG